MNAYIALAATSIFLAGCAISTSGEVTPARPVAAQGANDVQGNPISVPGSGMGVGSGVPGAATGPGTGLR
ncbi:hypothetical protein [Noviherbaspirillum sp.]|uniref:hypothetical protein n=1 Tax=Noviherbaspirillum sp. TaxID=1926288 RepID=UPI002FE08E04